MLALRSLRFAMPRRTTTRRLVTVYSLSSRLTQASTTTTAIKITVAAKNQTSGRSVTKLSRMPTTSGSRPTTPHLSIQETDHFHVGRPCHTSCSPSRISTMFLTSR